MKKYPAWQQAIRDAQAKDQELCREMDNDENDTVAVYLGELGLPEGEADGVYRVIKPYRFSYFENEENDTTHLTIERLSFFDNNRLFENIDISERFDAEQLPNIQAEIAYTFDRLEREHRFTLRFLFRRQDRIEVFENWKWAIRKWLGVS